MGAFLLTAVDRRIGITGGGHRIHANEVAIGMTLPRAAIEVCRGVLTPSALRQTLDVASPLTHDEAVAAGFLDLVVPQADLLDQARQAAEQMASLHADAHRGTKARTREPLLAALDAAIAADRAELRGLLGG